MGIYYVSGIPYSSDHLMHFGIKGQKWGIRRYQNSDGTLTAAGKERYSKEVSSHLSDLSSDLNPHSDNTYAYAILATTNKTTYNELKRASNNLREDADNLFNKEMEYDAISGIYYKDDAIKTKFENDVRKQYKDDIETAMKNGASEYDIYEFVSDVAYNNFTMSDHPLRMKELKARKDVEAASKQLKDSVENYSSAFLGVYGSIPAKSIKTGKDSTVKDLFSELIYKKAIDDSYKNYWTTKNNNK